MSRRLYSDITIQSQYIDNWQINRGSSEIGHTVKIQPLYTGSPQGSRSLLRIPGLGVADGILVQPPDIGIRCYVQAPMRPDARVRTSEQGNCNSRKLNEGHFHLKKCLKCGTTDFHLFSPGFWKSGNVTDVFCF